MKKHSVLICGHATSICLEEEFWAVLKQIAADKGISLAQLITDIDAQRQGNLSATLRLFILKHLQDEIRALKEKS